MKKNLFVYVGIAVSTVQISNAVLVESWENALDGWVTTAENPTYVASFSSTTGVTDQSFSLSLAGTAGPSYGQMLRSASTLGYTTLLGNSASLSIDVFTPAGSFGFFQQWTLSINNTDTGFVSVDGFSYSQSPTIGSQSTLTWAIPVGVRNTLAASSNPSEIIFQVGGGFTSGNETMYLDNVQVAPVPEPSVLALFGLGTLGLLKSARRRRC